MQLLDFCNSLIVAQVNYVLDTIERQGLDFANPKEAPAVASTYVKEGRFPAGYRDFLHKTFRGIDDKAFYLFKYVYENDRRYAFERVEWFHDFDEYLPITNI